ncbi:hypothetical protein G210_0905 [Candida maltosa Xu316]|uniref:Uncharacterized protein n=1 Tax=Candida maltosa (strain Xu316) TaxID=1245528 RepID=M3IPY9_CANMX|nr:hypothetical protein G210_0905 [Candida maltosa Xu316]
MSLSAFDVDELVQVQIDEYLHSEKLRLERKWQEKIAKLEKKIDRMQEIIEKLAAAHFTENPNLEPYSPCISPKSSVFNGLSTSYQDNPCMPENQNSLICNLGKTRLLAVEEEESIEFSKHEYPLLETPAKLTSYMNSTNGSCTKIHYTPTTNPPTFSDENYDVEVEERGDTCPKS